MKVADFDFSLPDACIAQVPADPRDTARMLCVGASLSDRHVFDLPGLLAPGDVLVVNDTRVLPARLEGWRGSVRVEITLLRQVTGGLWRTLVRPARRLRPGHHLTLPPADLSATVVDKLASGEVILDLSQSGPALMAILDQQGRMPLPPYIRRPRAREDDSLAAHDHRDYQTIFARDPGAVAAPTAGLHFTPRLLAALDAAGVRRRAVTLHVGAGTFAPVRTEYASEHPMHTEWGRLPADTAAMLNDARADGRRIIAVGTTSLRVLESACDETGRFHPFAGDIDLFILPGYRFRAVERLLTNFHLPRSTLFMLVSAFAGMRRMQHAYRHAIAEGYRFYSYGDACLLDPDGS